MLRAQRRGPGRPSLESRDTLNDTCGQARRVEHASNQIGFQEVSMTALGNRVHLFAQPRRREALRQLFENVLGCGPVATVEHPGMAEPMLIVGFPQGGDLSIEFVDDAPDDDQPLLGAWLELRTEDPEAVMRAVLAAGFREIEHPGHPHYFMAPGGQVFTVVPLQ